MTAFGGLGFSGGGLNENPCVGLLVGGLTREDPCGCLIPNIFLCSVTPPVVCFTVLELLSIGKVIDHTLALYLTFPDLIYFYFCGKLTFKKLTK